MKKTAVLLMAYGGPHQLQDIPAYLLNVRSGRATTPELIEEIQQRYAAIGGASPLVTITRRVAAGLETNLQTLFGKNIQTFVGMKNWTPYIHETLAEIVSLGFERIIAICMTPFDSRLTTEVYFRLLDEALANHPESGKIQIIRIPGWFQENGFAEILAKKVKQGLVVFDQKQTVQVFFTAHSLPASILKDDDLYPQQFSMLAKMVANLAAVPEGCWQTAYQSSGAGSIPWLGPDLETEVKKLSGGKRQQVLVAPIGFLCDHVEILYDLDIELQEETRGLGLTIHRTQSLNDDAEFIHVLTERIKRELS